MINYYTLLGVKPNAPKQEIEKAWKEKTKTFHPDKHDGNTSYSDLMQLINAAKDTLLNDEKRKQYDEMLSKSNPQQILSTEQQMTYLQNQVFDLMQQRNEVLKENDYLRKVNQQNENTIVRLKRAANTGGIVAVLAVLLSLAFIGGKGGRK